MGWRGRGGRGAPGTGNRAGGASTFPVSRFSFPGLSVRITESPPSSRCCFRYSIARARPSVKALLPDRKSTRLNSSHGYISYAVFCLKKKKKWYEINSDRYILGKVEPIRS